MTFDTDTLETPPVTATICENAALFGATPEPGEHDPRDIWDRDDASAAVSEAFRIIAQGVTPDGFQLADERESLLWGFVNMLHAQTLRLDRAVDRLTPRMRDLERAQDGTEINARDFIRARKDRETRAHLPEGTLVAVAGGKTVTDPGAVFTRLDKARAKYADMILVHGGGPGVEKIVAQWAERNGVHQVVCKPDWDRHGRAAPFRRNDELLNLLPKGLIAFPGNGITENLIDKATKLGIPVHRVAA